MLLFGTFATLQKQLVPATGLGAIRQVKLHSGRVKFSTQVWQGLEAKADAIATLVGLNVVRTAIIGLQTGETTLETSKKIFSCSFYRF